MQERGGGVEDHVHELNTWWAISKLKNLIFNGTIHNKISKTAHLKLLFASTDLWPILYFN